MHGMIRPQNTRFLVTDEQRSNRLHYAKRSLHSHAQLRVPLHIWNKGGAVFRAFSKSTRGFIGLQWRACSI